MELTLQYGPSNARIRRYRATILVFMELTLQWRYLVHYENNGLGHNPCFYGINFAIHQHQYYNIYQ